MWLTCSEATQKPKSVLVAEEADTENSLMFSSIYVKVERIDWADNDSLMGSWYHY
jgi:hypothetical protein